MAIDAGPLSGAVATPDAAPRLPYAAAVALVAFGVGTLLTLCDRFSHVAFGALSYTHPTWTGQAWWVWPNFIASSAGMYLGAVWLGFARCVRRPGDARVIVAILAFVAVYVASGVFVDHPRALLWGFVGAWILRLAFEPDRGPIAVFSLLLAVVGCAVEGGLTLTGEFSYGAPEWFHVPLWLAGLYLHGAFATLYLARRVEGAYGRLGV